MVKSFWYFRWRPIIYTEKHSSGKRKETSSFKLLRRWPSSSLRCHNSWGKIDISKIARGGGWAAVCFVKPVVNVITTQARYWTTLFSCTRTAVLVGRLYVLVNRLFLGVMFYWFSFFRDAEEGQPQRSKKELIALAKEIAAASKEVSAYSAKIVKNCPDKRISQVSQERSENLD